MKHYIDKDALVAEIEKRIKEEILSSCVDYFGYSEGKVEAFRNTLSFIDTLEVEEVDREKELETLDSLLYDLDGVAVKGTTNYLTVEDVKDIAKHFFELGLKVKGE